MASYDFPIGVGNNNPLTHSIYYDDYEEGRISPGPSEFLATTNGKKIVTTNGQFLVTIGD